MNKRTEKKVKRAVETLENVNHKVVQSIIGYYKNGYDLSEKQVKLLLLLEERHNKSIERGYGGLTTVNNNCLLENEICSDKISVERQDNSTINLIKLDDYGLNPYEFRVYFYVMVKCARIDEVCFAKQSTMAKSIGISVRSVQYALEVLCKAGVLQKIQRKRKLDGYRLTPINSWLDSSQLPGIREMVKSPGNKTEEVR